MIHYVCKYTPLELFKGFGEECAVLEEMPENFELSDQIAHANLCGFGKSVIQAVLEGKAKHQPYQKKLPKEQPFQLLVDIQGKMAEGKSVGYKKWATKFNLKEMSKTLLFLQ